MIKYFYFLFFAFISCTPNAQRFPKEIYLAYDNYKEPSFKVKRFKHSDVVQLIEKHKTSPDFIITEAGKSFEERSIYQVKFGKGPVKLLLWSQMHGNEATATMALFDIFNFLKASGDKFDSFRKELAEKATIYFIPMLNPDGAEKWQRRTAQEIDMNRDALRLVCPESRLLKNLQQTLKPDFGYNLHDQDHRISAGVSKNPATISFLASAYDHELSMNGVRKRSVQLISKMNKDLQQFIPGQIARYPDDHEPRAFGDNIQKWGTSLILIESGGYKNDPEKMYIRKLNFVSILSSFHHIIHKTYTKETHSEYEKIPENKNFLHDLIIRNVALTANNTSYKADIGISRNELTSDDFLTYTYKSVISDIGDLSTYYGFEEMDAKGAAITLQNDTIFTPKVGMPASFVLKDLGGKKTVVNNGFKE